jgi:hypothetical protein
MVAALIFFNSNIPIMAKHAKRKKAKPTRRRRRRIGALALSPSSNLVKFGAIAAGYFLGDKINAAIDKATGDKIDAKIVAGAEVGLGAMLVLKKTNKSLPAVIGGGILLGAGAKRAMSAFGLAGIGGYQSVPTVGGYQNVPAIGYGAKRLNTGGYVPGPGGINGYQVAKQAVGGLMDSGSGLMAN